MVEKGKAKFKERKSIKTRKEKGKRRNGKRNMTVNEESRGVRRRQDERGKK